jgi:hypothetical protein
VVHNAVDHCIGLTARGVLRGDSLMPPIASLHDIEPAVLSPLLLHHRLPDPMHLLENISQQLYAHLERSIDFKSMKHAHELMRTATGMTKLTGLVPSHRWRLVWGSYPVTWTLALAAPKYAAQRSMIQQLSLIASILYAKPEHRDTTSWLRLIGASFQLHRSLVAVGVSIRLSEHLLWPHLPVVYASIDGYNISCEAHEYVWKVVRKAWPAIDPLAPQAITQLMMRICSQNYARYLRVDKRDRRGHTLLHKWWKDQGVQRITIAGDASALVAMLQRFGFVEDQSWHRETGCVVLHTASADPRLLVPRPLSMAESAASIATLHTSYVYLTPSIANSHAVMARSTGDRRRQIRTQTCTETETRAKSHASAPSTLCEWYRRRRSVVCVGGR